MRGDTPTVALMPWGEVIEEFLRPIGLDLEGFARDMSGGWLFGYVAAMQTAGLRSIIVCCSDAVTRTTRLEHRATGVPIWALPGTVSRDASPDRAASRRALEQWLRTPWRALAAVLRKERCTTLLVQEYEYPRFDAMNLLGRVLGLPVYASFQGGDRTLSKLEAKLRGLSLRASKGLIVASKQERERLALRYPGSRLRIRDIPNPIDVDEWRPQPRTLARRELGLPQDSFIAINHGRIDIRRKGLDVLLRAWALFSRDKPRVQLIQIGSGQDREAYASLLERSRLPSVKWISDYLTDRSQMRLWLSAADVYISTSRTEGMPVAPLEAMACGLPLVASAAQGLSDLLVAGEDNGGILVPCDDDTATADALDRLLHGPGLRERMGRAARAHVETRYSLQAVGRELAAFLGSMP